MSRYDDEITRLSHEWFHAMGNGRIICDCTEPQPGERYIEVTIDLSEPAYATTWPK